jgi:hypothetical protein
VPTRAPDIHPVEGIWSLLQRSTTAHGDLHDRNYLVRAVRSGLRRIQRRTDLLEGCFAETGLMMPVFMAARGRPALPTGPCRTTPVSAYWCGPVVFD